MAPDTDVLPKPATTKIEPTTSTAADGSTKTKRRSMSVTSLREGVHIIPNEAEMKEATSVVRNPSPWRELDSDAFVIAYSMKGTAKCGACLSKVAKGELQVRAMIVRTIQCVLETVSSDFSQYVVKYPTWNPSAQHTM